MAEYTIAFVCLVAGTLLGLFISMLLYKRWGTVPPRRRKQRRKSRKAKTEQAKGRSRLQDKLAGKDQSYTDFCGAADGFDTAAYIRTRQAEQDEAYNSLFAKE